MIWTLWIIKTNQMGVEERKVESHDVIVRFFSLCRRATCDGGSSPVARWAYSVYANTRRM